MKLSLIYLFLLATFLSYGQKEDVQNKSAEQSDSDFSETMILMSSSEILPAKEVIENGIKFYVYYNNNNCIIKLTTDANFVTPEGYKVGDEYRVILEKDIIAMEKKPGFGYLINLKSGWQLVFCEGNTCTDNFPQKHSKIKWIMKSEL